jgi:selenocysteine lyase/cysteine desulfurase
VLFGSGRIFDAVDSSATGRPDGPWVVIDGYHAFMALDRPFGETRAVAFYLGGGYKYAMAGEGCAFLHAPPGFGPRRRSPAGSPSSRTSAFRRKRRLCEGCEPVHGRTFDPSALYRFNAVQRMLAETA